jgi:molybdopterin-containing oxidoreductase family iron-sulfur binding subunit
MVSNHEEVEATKVDLWTSFDRSVGHHFNLSIDLNACTGCGLVIVATLKIMFLVGKSEIRRSRDMHWLRIDRYYSSESTFEGDNERKDNISGLSSSLSTFNEMEKQGIILRSLSSQ